MTLGENAQVPVARNSCPLTQVTMTKRFRVYGVLLRRSSPLDETSGLVRFMTTSRSSPPPKLDDIATVNAPVSARSPNPEKPQPARPPVTRERVLENLPSPLTALPV